MKTWILFFCAFLCAEYIYAQPIIEENFIYPPGTLTQLTTNWMEDPLGTYDVQVVEGNLVYSGYPSSGAGNMIFLDGGGPRSGIRRSFPNISGVGKKIFVSLLLNLRDTLDLSSGNSFRVKGDDVAALYLYIQKVSGTGKYRIGISKGGSLMYDPVLRNTGETYLIVMAYQFQTAYDSVKLWINPDLSGSIPSPNLAFCPSGLEVTSINAIQFVQQNSTGNTYIDGIRLDTTWAQSPLPVELSGFTANIINDKIILKWRTETEVDNYGFELEKYTSAWEKISFIEGHGSCNTPNEYSFTDTNIINQTEIKYRLKQIDTDGAFTYSDEIKISIIPKEFTLYQNYPNPFNSSTKIRFNIPEEYAAEEAAVKLVLFNMIGEQSAVLINENKKAGIYEYSFNADELSLASGIYFYSIHIHYAGTGKSFYDTGKMILMR